MRWLAAIALLLLAIGAPIGVAYAISPLWLFNLLIPKDGGTRRVGQGIAYGALPRQTLDIYAPSRLRDGDRRPVVIFFYGGSWSSGSRANYGFIGRAFAAQGFVTVIPDYRLVPEVHFPAFVEDGAAAVRWVRAHIARSGGDPDRLILAGHSAGAYNAAMLALDPAWLGPDRRAVRGLIGLAGPYDFLPLDDPASIAAFSAVPDLTRTQPTHVAAAPSPPVLLATGDKDNRVRAYNSDNLAAVLTRLQVPVERRRYADVDHVGMLVDLARPLRGRAPVFRDAIAFARRVAGTPPKPVR
jgi:acetyl esterase/lipase